MEYDIFLSYSHKDAEIASGIYAKLDAAGYVCFMAEKEIKPAQEWSSTIHEAISSSKLIIILITPRSKDSLWVAAEAGAAWALKKNVIPALMFIEANELIQIINRWQSYVVETPTQIDKLISELPSYNILNPDNFSINEINRNSQHRENFSNLETWKSLIKIGSWRIDPHEKMIVGKGSYNYLLSKNKYGEKEFTINTEILFKEHENTSFSVNAGIVLGWENIGNTSTYYNLLFTGDRLLLEYTDTNAYFEHLDTGVEFLLKMNRPYKITIKFYKKILKVSINKMSLYSVHIEGGLLGNVGLRPWRTEMHCSNFEVIEGK